MRQGTRHAGLAGLVPALAQAAGEHADKLKGFGLAEGSSTPAFGRVIVVFLLLAAFAWSAAWLLRRYGARFGMRWGIAAVSTGTPIRPLARSSLPGGVTCHLIDAEGSRVLITVSRHGVSSLALGPSPAQPRAEQVT